MLVAAVRLGVDLRSIAHEAGGVKRVRLCEQRVVCGLRVIAVFVPLRREFVIVGSRTMMLGCAEVCLVRGMRRHTT